MDTCKQTFPLRSKDAKQRLGLSVQEVISGADGSINLNQDSARTSLGSLYFFSLYRSLFIAVIFTSYRYVLSPILHIFGAAQSGACRYPQNCSSFAKDAVIQKGIIVGSWLALLRILSCNPWMNPSSKLMSVNATAQLDLKKNSRITTTRYSNKACERQIHEI